MFMERMLLGSKEFLSFLEDGMFDMSDVIRKVAGLAAEDCGYRFGTAILVGKYIQHLEDHDQHTAKTRKRIEGILQRFCFVFGELDPHFVEAGLVSYWIRHQRWARSTQEWVALLVERLYRFGTDEGLVWTTMDGLQAHVIEHGGAHQ